MSFMLLPDPAQTGPPVLLIHGYGASAYHWRYQFKELVAAGFNVFALDLIGFGLSEKVRACSPPLLGMFIAV